MGQSREEGEYEESIQSNTFLTWNTILYGKVTKSRQHNTQENQEVKLFPASDHNAARNRLRQVCITKINIKHKNVQQKIFSDLKCNATYQHPKMRPYA